MDETYYCETYVDSKGIHARIYCYEDGDREVEIYVSEDVYESSAEAIEAATDEADRRGIDKYETCF